MNWLEKHITNGFARMFKVWNRYVDAIFAVMNRKTCRRFNEAIKQARPSNKVYNKNTNR